MSEPGALRLRDLTIAYSGAGTIMSVPALDVAAGSTIAIGGPSGTGKTSLLHALAGLERPAMGTVVWGDDALWSMTARTRDQWRRERLGLVFQDMHLLLGLSALDNVLLPTLFSRVRSSAVQRSRAGALLDMLGITHPGRDVVVMSRGERQRVAIARALLLCPAVLLADEPTASLDPASARQVAALIIRASAEQGATLVVTTHDPALMAQMHTQLHLSGGRLEHAA